MKDHLEKYIRSNKRAFDAAEPPEHIWMGVEAALNEAAGRKKNSNILTIRRFLSLAAVMLLVLTAGIVVYRHNMKATSNYRTIDPILAQQQEAYTAAIESKREQLAITAASNPALYQEFSSELNKMERNYLQLKKEMAQSPNKELTLEAMIRNLQMQVEVLNQQLEVFHYLHQQEKNTPYEQL